MADASFIVAALQSRSARELRPLLETFLPPHATREQKITTLETAFNSSIGNVLREAIAKWIVDEIVPVARLVPKSYSHWRLPVCEAMVFVVTHLSAKRLARKILEQIELPSRTSPELRLLRLIAKVPGLQKLGQVIARNQHLHPALRKALMRLEDGIRDVNPEQVRAIVEQELGERMTTFSVHLAPRILKEASVSAVIRFSWRNPQTLRRERGVFKVLKPHIPEYFAEDMEYLDGLARYFANVHHRYGFPAALIPDTFQKVRRLLKHEVNFRREQKTLLEAGALYRSFPAVRVPGVLLPLCTKRITALTEERGAKVTSAVAGLAPRERRQVAEQLVEALIAVPLFSAQKNALFHADPHAGNLLYDRRTKTLILIDWALRERLSFEQRRHLALLLLMVSLRDPGGACREIAALAQGRIVPNSKRGLVMRHKTEEFLDAFPPAQWPGPADAMRLLERIAVGGITFPSPLIMLSKVLFTLEGIVADLAGSDQAIGFTVARQFARRWLANRAQYRSPLTARDWSSVPSSAILFPSRLGIRWEEAILHRWLKPAKGAGRPFTPGSFARKPSGNRNNLLFRNRVARFIGEHSSPPGRPRVPPATEVLE